MLCWPNALLAGSLPFVPALCARRRALVAWQRGYDDESTARRVGG